MRNGVTYSVFMINDTTETPRTCRVTRASINHVQCSRHWLHEAYHHFIPLFIFESNSIYDSHIFFIDFNRTAFIDVGNNVFVAWS